jgi:hypothetical protein
MDSNLWYGSYLTTYLERDVRNLAGVGNLGLFRNFLRSAALRSGQLLNHSDLARDAGIAPNTARSWISVLRASGIVALLEPWHTSSQKRLVKSPKLYFLDTGLLCYLLETGSYSEFLKSPQNGHIFETWVYGQLHRLQSESSLPFRINFWQDKNGKEIDFLLSRSNRIVGIEVKSKEILEKRDSANFSYMENALSKLTRSYVVGWNSKAYPLEKNITALPAWELEKTLEILKSGGK